MKQFFSHIRGAVVSTLVLAVVCCGLYPLIVFGISQLLFRDQANGSLITGADGSVCGSKLRSKRKDSSARRAEGLVLPARSAEGRAAELRPGAATGGSRAAQADRHGAAGGRDAMDRGALQRPRFRCLPFPSPSTALRPICFYGQVKSNRSRCAKTWRRKRAANGFTLSTTLQLIRRLLQRGRRAFRTQAFLLFPSGLD